MRCLIGSAALGVAGWIAAGARTVFGERYGPYAQDLLLREREMSGGLDWVFTAMGLLVAAAGTARVCMLVRQRRPGAAREAILYGGFGSVLLLAPWLLEWAVMGGIAPPPWRGG